ncbi:MAG: bifunctional riboflavin kinase/FAD synthetase [Prevotella sp.]|nr:bifunctional riboflavin kinase/FAD synthetase [Prevotella sp.]
MNTIKLGIDSEVDVKPCVATIGFFDGVHRGHKYLIDHVKAEAAEDGLESMVITFDRHPRQVLHSDYVPQLLSTTESKLILFALTKVDNAVLLHFDKQMAAFTAKEFMEKILRDKLNVKKLVIGYDHRFGHDRAEGFDEYVRYGRELGIEVVRNNAFELNGVKVSSSVVRSFLQEGEIELANNCLGYPYIITGEVVEGEQNGRKIGYPTANLDTKESHQLIPAAGVYAVKVRLNGTMSWRPAMMNIGSRPTFNGKGNTIEINIFNFDDDIYGQQLQVAFIHRIREEQKFSSPEALAEQLAEDRRMVEKQFRKEIDDE